MLSMPANTRKTRQRDNTRQARQAQEKWNNETTQDKRNNSRQVRQARQHKPSETNKTWVETKQGLGWGNARQRKTSETSETMQDKRDKRDNSRQVRQARQLKTSAKNETFQYKRNKLDRGWDKVRHGKTRETTKTWIETNREMEWKNNTARWGRWKWTQPLVLAWSLLLYI
jgi:hypothetical protein